MWGGFFLEHPRSVGETYFEHQKRALSFGARLLLAGAACLAHALVPRLFVHTASSTVVALHREMAQRNVRASVPSRDYSPGLAE